MSYDQLWLNDNKTITNQSHKRGPAKLRSSASGYMPAILRGIYLSKRKIPVGVNMAGGLAFVSDFLKQLQTILYVLRYLNSNWRFTVDNPHYSTALI